ncbi:MAG: macrocin O-methyltransferase [Planctomycetes bacterium GWF2_41_51]|nr:MAG: macrocin O-methyltransferase [Planctomycetes bacterium GWF2_41_51]
MTRDLYLELLKKELTDQIHHPSDARLDGRDWPENGFTMIGLKRLENIQKCAIQIIEQNIEGDFFEAGVWKGGAAMFMRAILKCYGIGNRNVWLADSFRGLPAPKEQYPADKNDTHYQYKQLAISLEQVKQNFQALDLLDGQVKFIEGWFHETLYTAAVDKISLLRLDGDMYESTYVSLEALYNKVSAGGFIIVDDYGYIESCRKAVHDFLEKNSIEPIIEKIDWTGVYWRKA